MRAESSHQHNTTRFVRRRECANGGEQRINARLWTDLHTDRIRDSSTKLDMRAIRCTRAKSNPRNVRGEIEPPFTPRNLSRAGGFILKHEQFMTGVEVHALHRKNRSTRERFHEAQTLADRINHALILSRKRRVFHEIEIPIFRMMQIREATIHKRTHEVQRQRTALVAAQEQRRIRRARREFKLRPIDVVATKTRQFHAIPHFTHRTARLRVLPSKSSNARDPLSRSMHKHETHLQQNLQLRRDRP